MNRREEKELQSLPDKYVPMRAWSYFWYKILFSIPIIGWICLIIFSLDDSHIVRRNFCRSYFCIFVIMLILLLIVGVIAAVIFIAQGF